MTKLRVMVLGSGSVGLALATTYASADVDVTVLARGLAVQQLRQSGITVTGVAGDHHIEPRLIRRSSTSSCSIAASTPWAH
jgi:ketopantoate reductase